MSIYKYLEYREFLTSELKRRKEIQPSFTQEKLAEQCGMRNTYLSNVLKGRGNFNSDQIYALAHHLKLNESETHYLFLLKEYDQCTVAARKNKLKTEIESSRSKMNRTEAHISAKVRKDEPLLLMKYYSDPLVKVVHLMLQIPRYASNVSKISGELNIQPRQLRETLDILTETEMIRFKGNQVEVLQKNFHLPKESPMLLPHQLMMRSRSSQKLMETQPERRYSFSVTFSGTEKTRAHIHQQFLEFLKGVEKEVKDAPSENAYQINFDLFPWNETD